MSDRNLVLLILIVILSIILALAIYTIFTLNQWIAPQPLNHMMGMMGLMMMPLALWMIVIILAPILIILLVLYAGETSKGEEPRQPDSGVEAEGGELDDIFRLLKGDEKLIVKTLIDNGGKMLQSDLRWRTGLTRLQVHRVLKRLEERGILSRRRYGNTNMVELSEWIREKYMD